MYSSGSAMLPSTDAIASLRHTRRLRRHTGIHRSESSGVRIRLALSMIAVKYWLGAKYSACAMIDLAVFARAALDITSKRILLCAIHRFGNTDAPIHDVWQTCMHRPLRNARAGLRYD